jgi:enoyl-CoA hydratase
LVRLNVASAASTVHNLRIEISRYDFRTVAERSRNAKGRFHVYFAADGPCLSFAEIVNMAATRGNDSPMSPDMTAYETIIVERPDPRVARIVMNRPEARNAQNLQMTYDLNAAFDHAVQDDQVRVIILAGNGPHFSAGHDLRPGAKNAAGVDFPPVGSWGGFAEPNAHGRFAREQEIYLQITRRWRNLAKPMIAEVHGKCIAGGLMLAWACDLIVASSEAEFCDPVVTMGVCGVEWFVHPWELGPRKAKEFLFTSDVWSAAEAHRLGMVNHVVPRPELSSFVLALAQRIAAKPAFALKLTKEAVNRSVDVMGQPAAIDQAFALHQLCHAHNLQEFGMVVDPAGLHPSVRKPAIAK